MQQAVTTATGNSASDSFSQFLAPDKAFNIVLFMVSYILITGYSILLFMNPLNFVAVILKVLLVNVLAALNFANVF